MNVREAAELYQAQLRARDTEAMLRIVRAYQRVLDRLNPRIRALSEWLSEQQAAGEDVSPSWVVEQERWTDLRREILQEMAGYAQSLNGDVSKAQRAAIAIAISEAEKLTRASVGASQIMASWVSLDPRAVENMLGASLRGPLEALLRQIAPDAVEDSRSALVEAVALSENPRKTATRLRKALGVSMNRSLTIARTETLRAHRLAATQAYAANPAIISGWRWLSARDKRTCPVCWAMQGTLHPATEPFASHPNCRCTPVPETHSWHDILGDDGADLPDTSAGSRIPDGEAAFAALDSREQLAILGPGAYAAYKDGTPLSAFVGYASSPYGPTLYRKSLRSIGVSARDANIPHVPEPVSALPDGYVKPSSLITDEAPVIEEAAFARFSGAIDNAHAMPDWLHTTSIKDGSGKLDYGAQADFHPDSLTIHVGQIRTRDSEYTLLHEFGHRMDWVDGPGFISKGKAAVDVHHDRAGGIVDQPAELRDAMKAFLTAGKRSRTPAPPNIDSSYWNSAQEVWARAYAQWVAEQSGDATILAQLDAVIERGWGWTDFSELRSAVEHVMLVRGMVSLPVLT